MNIKYSYKYILIVVHILLIFKTGVFAENNSLVKSEKDTIKKGSIILYKDTIHYIQANDGSITSIQIPQGALDRDVNFNLTKDYVFDGIAYKFEMKDLSTGKTIYEFAKPVTITINYTVTGGIVTNTDVLEFDAASKLAIYYFDGFKWVPMNSIVNMDAKTVSTKTTHCYVFAAKENTTNNKVYASPSPFTPNGDGINDLAYFYFNNNNLNEIIVKIFNKKNKLIRTISSINPSWDGKDDTGTICQPGIYIFQLTVGGQDKRGVIVLVR